MAHETPCAPVLAQENVRGKQGEAQLAVGDIGNGDVHAQHRRHGDEAGIYNQNLSLFWAAFKRSALNLGWAISIRARARSLSLSGARLAIPHSVTIYCA